MLKSVKFLAIAFICLGGFVANAQKKINEGVMIYTVEYELPPEQQSMASMLPKENKVYFNGTMSKFNLDMGMFSTTVISNGETKEALSLTEVPMQNKKIAMKMNKEQVEAMQEKQGGIKDYEYKATSEKKMIAGFNCVKSTVTDKNSDFTGEIWATTDIEVPLNSLTSNYSTLKGVPVEFTSTMNGVKTKMTLKEVKEEKVGDLKMDVPAGYETMTFEEVMKQMGGQ